MRPTLARLLAIAALAGAAIALTGCSEEEQAGGGTTAAAPEAAEAAGQSGITVNGLGSVTVVPDRLDAVLGVETQGATAEEAVAANAEAMTRVIDALKGAGVAEEDLQTQQVSLFPRYSSDGQVIVGYSAVNTVTAKIRDLDAAGRVLDAAVAAGANQVYSLSLVVSEQDEAYRQALQAALADARSKAETLAEAAGVRLGAATSIVESGGAPPPPIPYAGAAEAAESVKTTPIEPGTQEIQATVTVRYATS